MRTTVRATRRKKETVIMRREKMITVDVKRTSEKDVFY